MNEIMTNEQLVDYLMGIVEKVRAGEYVDVEVDNVRPPLTDILGRDSLLLPTTTIRIQWGQM